MAPREESQEAGRTAKKGDKPSAAGQRKRKRKKQTKTGACGGVLLLSDLCFSKQNKQKQKRRRRKTKGKENEPKNSRPDVKRIFQTLSGANRQNIRPEPKQNATKKHKTNTNTQKQKFAPEKFSNSDPKKRKTAEKGKRRRTRHRKHKMKRRTAFPLSTRGNNKHWHCVTVRLPSDYVPHPFLGCPLRVRQEGGGGGETSSARQGGVRVTGPHPGSPKTTVIAAILRGYVLSFYPGLQMH